MFEGTVKAWLMEPVENFLGALGPEQLFPIHRQEVGIEAFHHRSDRLLR